MQQGDKSFYNQQFNWTGVDKFKFVALRQHHGSGGLALLFCF
jgi:hypothetical protein